MARSSAAAKQDTTLDEKKTPRLVGKPVVRALDDVKPNQWNPNKMTEFMMKSFESTMLSDGWLMSQALLIWGTDEKGKQKDVIIDGEHRWTVAKKIGLKRGPMVFLEGVTEAEAKALTIKMNQKRGSFDEDGLGALIRDINASLAVENLALNLGIEEENFMAYLAEPEVVLPGPEIEEEEAGGPGKTIFPQTDVRMVQLFLTAKTHDEFAGYMKKLATVYGTKNVTETTMEAVRRAAASVSNKS
jgi:hypothetical protein